MAKRRFIQQGFSLKMAVLAAVILLNGFLAFHQVRQTKSQEEPVRTCDMQAWSWVRASQELEADLRRWARLGGECLRAGFRPLEQIPNQEGKFLHRQLESAEPIVGMTKFPYVGVSSEAVFTPGMPAVLCFSGGFFPVEIKRMNTGEGVSTVQLAMDQNLQIPDSANILFLLQFDEKTLEILERKSGGRFLAERGRKGTVQPLVAKLDRFQALYQMDEFGDAFGAEFAFEAGSCSWTRQARVRLGASQVQSQKWIVERNDLFPKRAPKRQEASP